MFTTFPDLPKPKPFHLTGISPPNLHQNRHLTQPGQQGFYPLEGTQKVVNSEWEPMIHILHYEIMHAYVYVIYIYVHNRTTNIILIIGQVTFGYY